MLEVVLSEKKKKEKNRNNRKASMWIPKSGDRSSRVIFSKNYHLIPPIIVGYKHRIYYQHFTKLLTRTRAAA